MDIAHYTTCTVVCTHGLYDVHACIGILTLLDILLVLHILIVRMIRESRNSFITDHVVFPYDHVPSEILSALSVSEIVSRFALREDNGKEMDSHANSVEIGGNKI